MEEIWKDVRSYEGRYKVSNTGKVISLDYNNKGIVKEMAFRYNKSGYVQVILSNSGVKKYPFVHRLVAQAFIPNPKEYSEINHKDENPANNNVDNLEWCDRKYNINYGNHKEKMIRSKQTPILQMDKNGNVIARYDGIRDVERLKKFCRTCIYDCCNGKLKTSGGYIWRFDYAN